MIQLLLALALAAPTPPAVRDMIDGQLRAFESSDAQGAWKHVSPGLKAQFGTPERFWEMVKQGYQPVIAPRSVQYGEFGIYDGAPAQWLELRARDGNTYPALYLLEQQPDGSWRTNGCLLFEPAKPAEPSV